MDRRDFIKTTAMAGFLLLIGEKLRAAALPARAHALETWRGILEYARWSPSAHNIQPWLLELLSDYEMNIYLDADKTLPVADRQGAFITISLAMFTECVRISAENAGFASTVNFHEPAASNRFLFATVRLENRKADAYCDRELIKARKTSRLVFDGKCVKEEQLDWLFRNASLFGRQASHSSDDELVEKILALNSETLFTDMDDDAYRVELQRWIRTSDEEAQQKKDGLWSRCLGVPDKLLYNFFYHHERYKSDFKRYFIRKKYRKSFEGTRDIIWFAGSFDKHQDWVDCGVFLMRFWLDLTAQGLVMHPFGSLITHESVYRQLPAILKHEGESIWFIARIGKSAEAPRSLRKDVTNLLIET